MFHVPEKYRIKLTHDKTDCLFGNAGVFKLKFQDHGSLICSASDAHNWEHVAVTGKDRYPSFREMNAIKNIFWDADDLVVQMFLPDEMVKVDRDYTLHLWRRQFNNKFCPVPPGWLFGSNKR